MKIQLTERDLKLTKAQRAKVERWLDLILARYGERIDHLKVGLGGPDDDGCSQVTISIRMKPKLVRVEDSDSDIFVAIDRAAQRAARSVARAIERDGRWENAEAAPSVAIPRTSSVRIPRLKPLGRRKRVVTS